MGFVCFVFSSHLLKVTRDGLHCVPAYEIVDTVRWSFVM
jgi:hypothetical protein